MIRVTKSFSIISIIIFLFLTNVVVIYDTTGASCSCCPTDLTFYLKSACGCSLLQFNKISYLFLLTKDGCCGL